MNLPYHTLRIIFAGNHVPRRVFISIIRNEVAELIGQTMRLDMLLIEIAKNIFDHANGKGILMLRKQPDGTFAFEIRDHGTESYDFNLCRARPARHANGLNYGLGLGLITDLADSLGIKLSVDTSAGFAYSGIYDPKHQIGT